MKMLLVIASLAMVSILLALLHASYPLDYVARVVYRQDSGFLDHAWQPKELISGSKVPWILPRANQDERVELAFESHPFVSDLEAFHEALGTTAFIVLVDGGLAYERYFHGYDSSQVQPAFSVSKSIASLLLGRLIADGSISSAEVLLTDLVPELRGREQALDEVTLGQLLDMCSGVAYSPEVSFPYINSDDALIYYSNDLESVLLNRTHMESRPGTFEYNDYNPNLVALAITRATGSSFLELVGRYLWQPMGAEHDAYWITDWSGFARAESGLVAAPIDLARIGQRMLAGPDPAFITPEWHHRSTRRVNEHEFEEYNGRQWGYRNGWWLVSRPRPPHDYVAIGKFGQYIYVSPSNGVVIVRNGFDHVDMDDPDLTALFYHAAGQLGSTISNRADRRSSATEAISGNRQ